MGKENNKQEANRKNGQQINAYKKELIIELREYKMMKFSEISKLLSVSKSTASKIYNDWKDGKQTKQRGGAYNIKYNDTHLEFIKQLKESQPNITLHEIKRQMEVKFGTELKISISGLSNAINDRLKFRKIGREHNTKLSELHLEFIKHLKITFPGITLKEIQQQLISTFGEQLTMSITGLNYAINKRLKLSKV